MVLRPLTTSMTSGLLRTVASGTCLTQTAIFIGADSLGAARARSGLRMRECAASSAHACSDENGARRQRATVRQAGRHGLAQTPEDRAETLEAALGERARRSLAQRARLLAAREVGDHVLRGGRDAVAFSPVRPSERAGGELSAGSLRRVRRHPDRATGNTSARMPISTLEQGLGSPGPRRRQTAGRMREVTI